MPRFAASLSENHISGVQGPLRHLRRGGAFSVVGGAALFAVVAVFGFSTTSGASALVRGDVAGSRLEQSAGYKSTDASCAGQAWGAETTSCIDAIMREAGRTPPARLRLIATNWANAAKVPNSF